MNDMCIRDTALKNSEPIWVDKKTWLRIQLAQRTGVPYRFQFDLLPPEAVQVNGMVGYNFTFACDVTKYVEVIK